MAEPDAGAPEAPQPSHDPREHLRQHREASNQKTPFLKLPAELRNQIYELALPKEEVFCTFETSNKNKIEGIEAEKKHMCVSIESSSSYKQHFGITQICRQLRQETVKMAYRDNIFMLRVYQKGRCHRVSMDKAEKWVASRAPEAMKGLSRVILQYWSPDDYFRGMEMALFTPNLSDYKIISEANIKWCDSYGN